MQPVTLISSSLLFLFSCQSSLLLFLLLGFVSFSSSSNVLLRSGVASETMAVSSNRLVPSFTGFYWVLPGFTGCVLVLLGFYWFWLDFTKFP